VSAAEIVLKMTEHEAKMFIMSLLGSISAVADSEGEGRETAVRCLIDNANKTGLLQQFNLDCMMFDAKE